MYGDIAETTTARIGQNMKNMGQNLFTTYSPQRNLYLQTEHQKFETTSLSVRPAYFQMEC
jgi:hypothetical protein